MFVEWDKFDMQSGVHEKPAQVTCENQTGGNSEVSLRLKTEQLRKQIIHLQLIGSQALEINVKTLKSMHFTKPCDTLSNTKTLVSLAS